MVQCRKDLRFSGDRVTRSESFAKVSGSSLSATVPAQTGTARPIHCAHSAFAELAEDAIRAE
jgi:hypothetical protein